MDVSNGFGNRMDKDVSQICAEVLHTSSSSPQELGDSFRNNNLPYPSFLLWAFYLFSLLEAAVLDLVADDSGGMQKQKSRFHWDKEYLRSKKYIKLNNGDRVTASGKIKTEGGAKVTANKTGIYKR
ncbi:hypothetical protein CsSME_00045535 [Camellia sinensis var. sinensis]